MDVFIGNLSAAAKLIEIHHILGQYEMHTDFTTYEGKDCDHRTYHYVIVTTANKEQAQALIKRLNGVDFCGQPLEVREYIQRDHSNQHTWDGKDRRINEQLSLALEP